MVWFQLRLIIISCLLVYIFGSSFTSACSTAWFLGPSAPSDFLFPLTAVVNDSIYLIPWDYQGPAPLVFQTSSYKWSSISAPPISVQDSKLLSSAAVNGIVYLFSDPVNPYAVPGSVQTFNPQTNEWSIILSTIQLNCTRVTLIPSVVISTTIYLLCTDSFLTFDTLTRELKSNPWTPPFEFSEIGSGTTASAVNDSIKFSLLIREDNPGLLSKR